MSELNKEFDLIGKAKKITSAAADLSDKAIDAVDEANTKYDFVKVAKDTANKAIDAVKEQSNQSTEWACDLNRWWDFVSSIAQFILYPIDFSCRWHRKRLFQFELGYKMPVLVQDMNSMMMPTEIIIWKLFEN